MKQTVMATIAATRHAKAHDFSKHECPREFLEEDDEDEDDDGDVEGTPCSRSRSVEVGTYRSNRSYLASDILENSVGRSVTSYQRSRNHSKKFKRKKRGGERTGVSEKDI